MLVTSIFSFSQNVFKSLIPQGRYKLGLRGGELTLNHMTKIIDKAFADDKLITTQQLKFVHERVQNIVLKEENTGYQQFLLFPLCFQKLSYLQVLKVRT